MFLEIFLAFIFGIIAGTFTGLAPGIHINLVAALLLASLSASVFSGVPPLAFAVFIVAMSMTHVFVDFIPSIFLGAPDEDTVLAVLPGHEMLLEGRGFDATVFTLYGALTGLALLPVFSIFFVIFLPIFFGFIKGSIAFILICVSLYLVFREKDFLISLTVFLLAGFLGWFTFHLPVREPLLPLLSGLFGISGLLLSVREKNQILHQQISHIRDVRVDRGTLIQSIFGAVVAGPLCSFLPGIGSGHASVLGAEIGDSDRDNRGFLIMVGAINTLVMGLSFVTAYSIGKGRTGSAASVQELLGTITGGELLLILGVCVLAGVCAFFISVFLARIFAQYIAQVNYRIVSWCVIGIVLMVNVFLSNWIGLIVLVTGTAMGMFCIISGVRRIQMMGCLLLPSIIYYLTL